jgi:hypothetical protein
MKNGEFSLTPPGVRHFFIQSVDGPSGFAVSEVYCGLSSVETIAKAIDASINEFDPGNIHILDKEQVSKIRRLFNINFEFDDNEPQLRSWSSIDGLPYRVHPNRELILMLDGIKPLSVLSGLIPKNDNFVEIPDYLFDPYVDVGRFIKREYCEPNVVKGTPYKGLRFVLYALEKEEWRIDAYLLVRNVSKKIGWTEPLTRIEGSLLGYTEWQNDAFIANLREKENAIDPNPSIGPISA